MGFAADIHLVPSDDGNHIVVVDGPIIPGDEYKFASTIAGFSKLTISLSSSGGRTDVALFIGRVIRQRQYATLVPEKSVCASACAMIWVAGTPREMHESSRIGFHATFVQTKDGYAISSEGNALVGAYYAEMGLGSAVIVYCTQAPPNSVKWFSRSDGSAIGLETELVTATSISRPTSLTSIMFDPHPFGENLDDVVRPGEHSELLGIPYDVLNGRGVESCGLACSEDEQCVGANLYPNGACTLLSRQTGIRFQADVTSWQKWN